MDNMDNLVTEQVAENVEITTEETPKTFSQEDVDRMVKEKLDEVLPGKIARREAKIRKEYENRYGQLEDVLKAGTGKKSVEELTDGFKKYYESKGVKITERSQHSDRDVEVLARADADEIIRAGYDEVVAEIEQLARKGTADMTPREKALYKQLSEHRQNTERGRELSKIGVTEDVYNSPEFKAFAGKFASNTPITEVYDIYAKTKPKKEIKLAGSMKSSTAKETGVKDFYSYEEAVKFTKQDFDKNPELYRKVQESMTKWK